MEGSSERSKGRPPSELWARVYRGKHTLAQGVVSALVAGIVTPLVYWGVLAVLKRL